VTMAVGFLCIKGVVIAADRQMTGSSYTFQECKLGSFKWLNGRAIWGYSGNYDTAKVVGQQLESRFGLNATIQPSDIQENLKQALLSSIPKKESFQNLFGVVAEGQIKLFVCSGSMVTDAGRCEIIGWGDSALGRYLRGLFLKGLMLPTTMQAAVAGIYLILQGKNYDGQYVGGGPDVLTLSLDGTMGVIDRAKSGEWEKELETIEGWTVQTFNFLTEPRITPEWISRRFEEFNSKAESFCSKVRGATG